MITQNMTEVSEEEYIEMVLASAVELWGDEEAEKMRDHIVKTAGAVWHIGAEGLDPSIEPATRLRHCE